MGIVHERRGIVPAPDHFRTWLKACLPLVGARPAGLSKALGLGRNTLGDFLAKDGRDINMGTAERVHREVHRLAAEAGLELPALEGAAE